MPDWLPWAIILLWVAVDAYLTWRRYRKWKIELRAKFTPANWGEAQQWANMRGR